MPATTTDVLAVCSFCLKPDTEVGTLVAGLGVYICDECVALCATLITTKPPRPAKVERVAPWEHETDVDHVLATLPRIAVAADQVDHSLTEWVRRARALGATWARVGESLGMARQSAWERFSGEE